MQPTDIQRRAEAILSSVDDLERACLAFDDLLRRGIDYDVAAWATHDPATGLFTSCTMTGIPKDVAREARMFREEFRENEPATYRSLIADHADVAILSEVTEGDLARAARYRNLLQGFGVTDELRTVLWADDVAWGSATLYRQGGTFTASDAELASAASPLAAEALRLVLLRAAATRPTAVDDPPGILQVHPDGRIQPLTEPSGQWLALGGQALTTAAVATAAALRQHEGWRGTRTRLALPAGTIVSLVATSMTQSDGSVAVIVDRARRAEVGELMVAAYGLTPRQREVLGLLLLGRSMTQVARELGISEHTANDHRKAIYRQIGVSSRSELAALLQAEQYDPRSHRGVPPSPYGGFLE